MTELLLQTVTSYWMAAGRHPTLESYRRVIGVETAAGAVACRFALPEVPKAMSFEVPEQMATDVLDFFDEHIADVDPEDPYSSSPSPLRYNCHTFALALQGMRTKTIRELDDHLKMFCKIATPLLEPLAAGRHGIVFNSQIDHLSHSFVGLGADSPFTLQVTNYNSNMAIMPYTQLVPEYSLYQGGQYVLAA